MWILSLHTTFPNWLTRHVNSLLGLLIRVKHCISYCTSRKCKDEISCLNVFRFYFWSAFIIFFFIYLQTKPYCGLGLKTAYSLFLLVCYYTILGFASFNFPSLALSQSAPFLLSTPALLLHSWRSFYFSTCSKQNWSNPDLYEKGKCVCWRGGLQLCLWKVKCALCVCKCVSDAGREGAESIMQVNQKHRDQGETLYKIIDKWSVSGSSQTHHG